MGKGLEHVEQSRDYKTIDLLCFAIDLKKKQSSLFLGIFIHRAFRGLGQSFWSPWLYPPHPSFPGWDLTRNLGQLLNSSTRWDLGVNSSLPLSPQMFKDKVWSPEFRNRAVTVHCEAWAEPFPSPSLLFFFFLSVILMLQSWCQVYVEHRAWHTVGIHLL